MPHDIGPATNPKNNTATKSKSTTDKNINKKRRMTSSHRNGSKSKLSGYTAFFDDYKTVYFQENCTLLGKAALDQ